MAAFNLNNWRDTATSFRVNVTTDIGTLSSMLINGVMRHIFATTVTTVVEFRGLTRAQALAMGESEDYNYNSKHGVLFKSAAGSLYAWMKCDMCEGDECRADPRRINEADMWRVTVTFSRTTATHSAWTIKETY